MHATVRHLFSGQSEQGWELFSLAPELRHVGSLPYVEGEGDPPQFSPDGQWLAMLVAVTPRVRWPSQLLELALHTAAVEVFRAAEERLEYRGGSDFPAKTDIHGIAALAVGRPPSRA